MSTLLKQTLTVYLSSTRTRTTHLSQSVSIVYKASCSMHSDPQSFCSCMKANLMRMNRTCVPETTRLLKGLQGPARARMYSQISTTKSLAIRLVVVQSSFWLTALIDGRSGVLVSCRVGRWHKSPFSMKKFLIWLCKKQSYYLTLPERFVTGIYHTREYSYCRRCHYPC